MPDERPAQPAARSSPASSQLLRSLLPWTAAACFALLAGWFAQLHLSSRSEARLLATQQALADLALTSAHHQLEAERILTRRQLADLNQPVATPGHRLERETDLARFKITTLSSRLNDSSPMRSVAVWNPGNQEGLLKVEQLPPPAAHQDYQLWIVDPQYPNPVDAGVFTVDPQTGAASVPFKARLPVDAIDAFMVSLERKGGVPKPEGPIVLLGK